MPSPFSPDKFDVGIVNTDAINVGFMLAKKAGAPVYAVFDDEYLALQFFTGEPGYANLPTERELAIRQVSWRAGFGLDVYNSDEPERYYNSRGMDMRFRGMGISGQAPVNASPNISFPIPIVVDGGLESWVSTTNLASWSEQSSSGSVQQSSVNVHGGTYSAKLYTNTPGGAKAGISQILSGWHNALRGSPVVINVWVQQGAGSITACNLEISDGINQTVAQFVSNTSYQLLTVNHVIAPTGTQINAHVGVLGSGGLQGNVFVDDFSLAFTPYKSPASFADFNQKLFFSLGKHLIRMDATNGAFTVVNVGFPANITRIEPFVDASLYIAVNTVNAYSSINTGEILTTAGAGVNTFQFFKTVFSATPNLYGNDGKNTIRSNPTPSNASSWTAQTTVSSNYDSITDLLSRSGALYIMKEDMPYYLDSTGAVKNDLAPKLAALRSATSGKNSHTDGDKIWIPAGSQSLLEEDSGVLTWRTPALFSTNLTEYSGRIAAVTSDDMYLYVVINGTGVCHVLAGRNETIGSSTQWVWHPIAEVPIAACETAYVSSVYQKRLWITSTTGEVFYIPLYSDYGNPTNDINRAFATNVEIQTPWLHANFMDTVKAFPKIKALLGHPYNTSVFFNCQYKTLGNASWSVVKNLKGSATSMIATSFLPQTSDTMIRFKFIANTAYTDKTPVLLGYNVLGLLYPPQRKIIACTIRCADEIYLRDGTSDVGSFSVIEAVISEAIKSQWPVTFYDIDGVQKYVKFLSLPSNVPRWTTVIDEKSRKPERHYALLLQEVELS